MKWMKNKMKSIKFILIFLFSLYITACNNSKNEQVTDTPPPVTIPKEPVEPITIESSSFPRVMKFR